MNALADTPTYKKFFFVLLFPLVSTLNIWSQSLDSTAQIFITEIMYDPASSSTTVWEYVEIYNADTIAYNLSGSVLDDAAGSVLSTPNIVSGTIQPRATAVLYNSDNHIDSLYGAWDTTINFIAVHNWGILNNNGDRVGFWANLDHYNGRDYSATITDVFYEGGGEWPVHDGLGSIELSCDVLTNCNLSDGSNWHLNNGSMWSQPAGNNMGINHGSPGVFPNPPPLVIANRFEFLPLPLDTGMVDVLFGIRVCATNGSFTQLDYSQEISLIDSTSTAQYILISSDILSPLEGCVNFMISPISAGKIRLDIGNEDFTNLQTVIVIKAIPTTIQEVNKVKKIKLYPTVASHFLNLEWRRTASKKSKIRIFNDQGSLIQTAWMETGRSKMTLDISEWMTGIYFLKIEDETVRFFKF